jgi:hypothetical protein
MQLLKVKKNPKGFTGYLYATERLSSVRADKSQAGDSTAAV